MTVTREDDIRRRLEQIYHGIRGAQRRLWPQDRLAEDLHIDSLSGLELLVRVEDEFGIRLVDDPRAGTLRTVGDLTALIAELCRKADGAAGEAPGGTAQATSSEAER